LVAGPKTNDKIGCWTLALGFESQTFQTDATVTVQLIAQFLLYVSHKYKHVSKEESKEQFALFLDNKIGLEGSRN